MATNWNQPLAGWAETIAGWIREPTPDNLMVSSIFFDFRAVAGDLDTTPLADLVAGSAENQLFLAHLARVSLRFKPPLGLFRRIRAEDGRVDVKKRGIASVVAAARVYALEAGVRARPTRERLEAAMDRGVISRDLGETLVETYRFLLQLRLSAQLDAVRAGREPDNDIRLGALSSLEHRHLKDAFAAIGEMQQALARRFRTDSLG
jgi:CBS domain-containing protein